jgi:hypothetical protein
MAHKYCCPVVIGSFRCGRLRNSRKQLSDHMLLSHLVEPVSLKNGTYRILPINNRTRNRWARLHDHLGLQAGHWPPGLYPKRKSERTIEVVSGSNRQHEKKQTADDRPPQAMDLPCSEKSDDVDWQELEADMCSLFELAETDVSIDDINGVTSTQQRTATREEDSDGQQAASHRETPPASPDEVDDVEAHDRWLPPPTTSPTVLHLRQELATLIEQAKLSPGTSQRETFILVDGQITALQAIISNLKSIPAGPCRSCPLARGPCRLCLAEVYQPVLDGSHTPVFLPTKSTDSCRMLDPHDAVVTAVQDILNHAPENGCVACILPAQLCRHCWLVQLSNELLPLMIHRQ